MAQMLSGLAITMGNPRAMLFYVALLPNLVIPGRVSVPLFLSLMLTVIVVLATAFAIYVLAAAKARSVMTSSQSVRKLNRVTATTLGGAATWIAAS